MTEDSSDELTNRGLLIQGIMVAFFVGGFIGWFLGQHYYEPPRASPVEIVDLAEDMFFGITTVRPNVLNDRTTIGGLKETYKLYSIVSRGMLSSEISTLCGPGEDWDYLAIENLSKNPVEHLNDTINVFCNTLCSDIPPETAETGQFISGEMFIDDIKR